MKRSRVSRSTSKAVARRKLSYANVTKAIAAPSVGLGQSARTILKTEFFVNITPAGANGVWTGFLKPGSAFDPCGDVAAIQPALYDQWAATYGRYVVEKAYVKIEFANQQSLAGGMPAFLAAAYPSISSQALSTYQGAASQPFAKTIMHGPYDNSTSSSMSFKLDHAKVLGKKGPVSAEDNGALTGADPSSGEFMVLPLFVQNVTNSNTAITARVKMYQTVWFDRRINVVDA